MPSSSSAQPEGVFVRRWTRFTGLFFDDFATESAWIRDRGTVYFPPLGDLKRLRIRGEIRPHLSVRGLDEGIPGLDLYLCGTSIARITPGPTGAWETTIDVPLDYAEQGAVLELVLRKVALTNFLAWAGRVMADWPMARGLQRFREQSKNRQLRIAQIEADGELVYDFSNRHSPYSAHFARKHARIGLNIVGYFTAELGVGESARCMLRASDADNIPAVAIALKLPCKARLGDQTYSAFLQETNPHGVNVFHLDPPAAADLDTHHGPAFRSSKYNVGYWAWELPEFPDAWISYFDFFHEIWCPSDFVRATIAEKSPLPVITMPHAIAFNRPTAPRDQLRARFSLPKDAFLFLFLYDLNSYSERKNPRAAINAFRESGLAAKGAVLVIKVHGAEGNETDLTALRSVVADLPGTVLLTESFSRADIYALEASCDCFVSLHRSEGFGLAVAECMYLGKPVISTDWSATSEYLNAENGCPVRCKLVTLERNHGPYSKGQTWAEPDVVHAAEWMQKLFSDPLLAARLGAAARSTIEQRFSLEAIAARYRRRLEAIASW